MAEQLVLLEEAERSEPRAPRPTLHQEWRLDEHTLAVGRRGLERARRALGGAGSRAA